MTNDDTFITAPMTVPGQLTLDECQHDSLLQVPKPGATSIGYPCFYRCESCGREFGELSDRRAIDECSPVGMERVNVPLDETHSESIIATRIIRSEFQQLRLEASRWTPGGDR